jgi:hypothetical protein
MLVCRFPLSGVNAADPTPPTAAATPPHPPLGGRPGWRLRAFSLAWLALLASAMASAQAIAATAADSAQAAPPDCSLLWQVSVPLGGAARSWRVNMDFDAGPRTRSTLRLPAGWTALTELPAGAQDSPPIVAPNVAPNVAPSTGSDTASAAGPTSRRQTQAPRLRAVADDPTLRIVEHARGERVHLRWSFSAPVDAAQAGSVQWTADWFALAGQGLLPMPEDIDERHPPTACVALTTLAETEDPDAAPRADAPALPDQARPVMRWATSHGNAEGPSALLRIEPGAAALRVRVQQAIYAGGALELLSQTLEGQVVTVARPAAPAWRFGLAALAQASAQAAAAQRQFWGDSAASGHLLVLLLPGPATPQGMAWQQALTLQSPADLALPGAGFDALITQALVRSWVLDRFGPLTYNGHNDGALRTWFSAGFADFYTHRLLLRERLWTPEDYASALNHKIERWLAATDRLAAQRSGAGAGPADAALVSAPPPDPGADGEWLALQWHAALRAKGQPGLDTLMRSLRVPAEQARREGPTSAPLATHRLVAALRPLLDEAPLRDITRQIERGERFSFEADSLGPCFVGQRLQVPAWRLGFDADSLSRQIVRGVEPGGPAEGAGLRDGMALAGHLMTPGDATQPVQLQVREADGSLRTIAFLPAGESVRELPRYRAVAQAMQQPACLGWLALGPEATLAAGSQRPVAKAAGRAGKPSATGKRATQPRSSAKSGKPSGTQSGKPSSTGKTATQRSSRGGAASPSKASPGAKAKPP